MMTAGTRLGPYEIIGPVGAGGMGEVYRARDTRLERTVAIKILPAEFAHDAQLRQRFEREAKTISQLNHPHICALYDIGEQDGISYLVMEFLEGESLAQRLTRGPLPIEQAVRLGTNIAEALERAHRQGVVHRDVKPANIILTKSGAKLLDFGLAKPAGGILNPQGQTEHKPLTQEGSIVGTFHYMAPEQVEGREADARSDIFSLGATLYEAATGARAFDGKSRASVIAAILDRDPPPISAVQPLTPPAFDRLVRTCLAKDPDERWQSAHDVAAELKWIAQSSSEAAAVRAPQRLSRRIVWGMAGLLLGLLLGAAGSLLLRRDATPLVTSRFAVSVPAAQAIDLGSIASLAISPDGNRIAYRVRSGGDHFLASRSMGQFNAVMLPETKGVGTFAFSPDGQWLVFSVFGGAIKKIAVDGGSAVNVTDLSGASIGLDWYGDTIYLNRNFSAGIWAVPATGGTARQVIKLDAASGQRAVVWPQMLPGGKAILATIWTGASWDEAKLAVFPLATGKARIVVDGGTYGRYADSGHIVFGRGAALYAVPFDLKTLQATGAAVPVVKGVASGVLNGDVHYAVSRSGTLAYVPGGLVEEKRSLLWVDRKGKETRVVPTDRPYDSPALSAASQSIAVCIESATFDIWLLDPERDSLSRVSFGGDDSGPIWTPDGRRVLWRSTRAGTADIYWAPIDGSSSEEPLLAGPDEDSASDVSADGRHLLFNRGSTTRPADLWVLPLEGSERKPRPFLATPFAEAGGAFSPDGRWVLYRSNESGRNEIYVRPFPGPGGKWQISIDGGSGAVFTRDGREIIYRLGRKFFVVPIRTDPAFRPGKPQLLFEREYLGDWNLGRTDNELMVVKRDVPNTASQLHIVLNWFGELERRAR